MIIRGVIPAIHVFRRSIASRDAWGAGGFSRRQRCYCGSTPAFLASTAYFASSERK